MGLVSGRAQLASITKGNALSPITVLSFHVGMRVLSCARKLSWNFAIASTTPKICRSDISHCRRGTRRREGAMAFKTRSKEEE